MTSEEKSLLKKLSSGALDGSVGDKFYTSGGSAVWTVIKDGVITRFKQGPSRKFFDGKENVRTEGVLHILAQWKTPDEILAFLQKFGWLLPDKTAKSYSAKFKK